MMLVLSRHESEVIHIGDEVKLVVVKIQGNLVRIGIEAPHHIPIRRGELDTTTTTQGMADVSGSV